MLEVSQLFVYPIKSLHGISVNSAQVTERGLQYDRRWMLVNENGDFISQRTFTDLALFHVSIKNDHLFVKYKKNGNNITVPFKLAGETFRVTVWDDVCKGLEVNRQVSEWFSNLLCVKCKLVYMPDGSKRKVHTRYACNNEITSFSDGYPFMMIGQSSLDDLNNRMEEPLPMDRFRPNIVFTGGTAFEEDGMAHFTINNIHFYGVKLCARCVVTTIDQDEAIKGKEPLKTLATYRMVNNKIYFGQNLLHTGDGVINVGDVIEVKETKSCRVFPQEIL